MRVLVACEFSGRVREAFRKRGHDAWSCDFLPAEDDSPYHYQQDVLSIIDHDWDLMVAHPPCTYLTLAGNKWMLPAYRERFPRRHEQREEAVNFFLSLASAPIKRIAIENPLGVMSTRFRKPDQIIQPHNFGVPIRKTTCLWLKNLPPLFSTIQAEPELDKFPSGNTQSKWHTETGHIKDKHERMKARSRTFTEIADAMADQWSKP